jgi:hypothetical protein
MIGEAWGMLSTPIFEQLCRELVGSGEPGEVRVEVAEAGANNQKSTTCPEPVTGPVPGREPESDPEAEPDSDAELDAEPESVPGSDAEPDAEPETAVESVPEAEPRSAAVPEVGWTVPEERVA